MVRRPVGQNIVSLMDSRIPTIQHQHSCFLCSELQKAVGKSVFFFFFLCWKRGRLCLKDGKNKVGNLQSFGSTRLSLTDCSLIFNILSLSQLTIAFICVWWRTDYVEEDRRLYRVHSAWLWLTVVSYQTSHALESYQTEALIKYNHSPGVIQLKS